jgi:hypothetical protein
MEKAHMNHRWLNEKQPDENGDITAVVENADGTPVSVFKGKDIDEVAEKLLVGQTQANREIARLFKKIRPDQGRKTLKPQTRVLTADDKFRLATEMSDPDKIVGAVQEIVNSTTKVPLADIAERALEDDQKQSDEFIRAEAFAFREEVPEYNPTDKNMFALFDELKANGWSITRNNLAIAFNTLKERGEMEPWPMEGAMMPPTEGNREGGNSAPVTAPIPIALAPPNGQPEPTPPPSPRPRSIATGIRNSDASALPPPPPRKKQYTRADIERMPRAEYMTKLQDPEFRRQVDAMGS